MREKTIHFTDFSGSLLLNQQFRKQVPRVVEPEKRPLNALKFCSFVQCRWLAQVQLAGKGHYCYPARQD
jgi:hypothetical protein